MCRSEIWAILYPSNDSGNSLNFNGISFTTTFLHPAVSPYIPEMKTMIPSTIPATNPALRAGSQNLPMNLPMNVDTANAPNGAKKAIISPVIV